MPGSFSIHSKQAKWIAVSNAESERGVNPFKIEFWFLVAVCILIPFAYLLWEERVPEKLEFMEEGSSPIRARVLLPLPVRNDADPLRARSGKTLWFYEAGCERCHRLANTRPDVCFEVPGTNCRSCHVPPLRGSGGDGEAVSSRSNAQRSPRNALSVWNARYNIGYGWDGREFELQGFVASHLNDPAIYTDEERDAILRQIRNRREYASLATQGAPESALIEGAASALAEYVKTLVASNSRFDRYLRGEKGVLTPLEEKGYAVFKTRGCIVCHNGINIGGNSFKIFGVYKLHMLNDTIGWYTMLGKTFEDENLRREDKGIFELTQIPTDRYRFRVASLRNVELNRPYFTQGQVWELSEAIRTMGRVQLGVELQEWEVRALEAFLGTLSGRIGVINPPLREEGP